MNPAKQATGTARRRGDRNSGGRDELAIAIEHASITAPGTDEQAAIPHGIKNNLKTGLVPAPKALLQALVHEIRVEGRD